METMDIRWFVTLAAVAVLACGSGGAVRSGDVTEPAGADSGTVDSSDSGRSPISPPQAVSSGCGLARAHEPGGVQVESTFSELAGGKRSFYLSVPASYDPAVPQRLIFGYAGTNWTGQKIAPYLGLETTAPQAGEIYVYPDLQWHDFKGWGNIGGWLLGWLPSLQE